MRRRFYLGDAAQPMQPTGNPGPFPGPAPENQFVQDWFTYTIASLGLSSAGSFIGNIQIDADSDFILTKMSAKVNTTGSDTSLPLDDVLATILLVDGGSQRNLMSAPTPIPALFGTGELPHILAQPRTFKSRTNIAITIANYSVGTSYDIYLAFEGRKVFKFGGA